MLFTENQTCIIYFSDTPPVTVFGDAFKNLLSKYRAAMVDAGSQPLHLDTNLTIHEQTYDGAVAEAYMIYITLKIAAFNVPVKTFFETRVTGTARYTWDLLKGGDDIWRINAYKISYFQNVVETSAA